MRASGALEDQSRRVIPAAFEHPASASELVVGKINVSLMARVIFHYVQFARELLHPRLSRSERTNRALKRETKTSKKCQSRNRIVSLIVSRKVNRFSRNTGKQNRSSS